MSEGRALPRLVERPHGSPLLTRGEVADLLGYSRTSMATVMGRDPGRWPRPAAMLQTGVRSWSMLWDRDEILAAAPPAAANIRTRSAATISDPDGLIPCLECGRRFRSLGRHLHAAHDLSAAEYRDRHRLPATAALNSDGARQANRNYWISRLAVDPEAVSHLRQWHDPETLDRMRETAIARHHETRDLDTVRKHRAPGQTYAVQVMNGRRRDRLDAVARRAGFESLADAIHATAHLPSREAAARIGIGASTVLRHRQAGIHSPSRMKP